MVEDNLIKISSHWIEWMSMSNKEITPDLYVILKKIQKNWEEI